MIWRFPVLLLVAVAAISHAASPITQPSAPTAFPQWSAVFSRAVFASDSIASMAGPTWGRLPGGDTVVVTSTSTSAGDALLVRRFAADGSVRVARVESLAATGISNDLYDVVVKVDASGDGIYVLAGSWRGACQILRLGMDLRHEWSMPAPVPNISSGRCRNLLVLPDGSALALRQSTLARINRNGQVLWSVNGGNDLTVDANGTIWVASNGGSSGNDAAVLRFDVDGAFLSGDYFLCAACIASQSLSVDAMPDGSVSVGGGSGSGQPGFFARYGPDGARRLLVNTANDVGYARVVHDLQGAIYVSVQVAWDAPTEVRRIDAQTGAVLWAVPADDFTAAQSGVVITRATASAVVAIALDASGNVQWTRTLSATAPANVSRGSYRDGQVELLVQTNAPSPDCGKSPRFIALDAAGTIAATLHACAMPGETYLQSIDALADVGVLVDLGYQLAAYSADGDLRWQATRCALCTGGAQGDLLWGSAILTPDGGAWAVEGAADAVFWPTVATGIARIGADGATLATLPIAATDANPAGVQLLGSAGEVIALQPSRVAQSVFWQRARSDGIVLETRQYPVPDTDFQIDAARRLADGGASLVVKGTVICGVGCNPHYVTVLRLAADGTLRWRYQFPESDAIVALHDDGGASAVLYPLNDGLPQLREIGANGQPGADIALAGVRAWSHPVQLAGPVRGLRLLRTQGGYPSEQWLWSIDAAAQIPASRLIGPYDAQILDVGRFGYLFAEGVTGAADAELLDPVSLATTASFRFGYGDRTFNVYAPWRLLDDGSVYAGAPVYREPGFRQASVARFSVPGGPASDLVFRDDFD